MKQLNYNWNEFERDVSFILQYVPFEDYSCIAPIAFGGLPLGTKLKNVTGLPARVIFASSYEGQKRKKLKVKTGDLDKLKDKVLLLDDVSDSGTTLTWVTKYLDQKEIDYDTLTLYYKKGSLYKPTYFVHQVPNKVWLNFCWE